jgi:N,N'-diacetyllegionaminate synthase
MAQRTLVIADPGNTADGGYNNMRGLIVAAAQSGCDGIKFQWTSSAARMCERRNAPEYRDAYDKLQFPSEWHEQFRRDCVREGIAYLCTVFLPEDIAAVAPFVSHFKVSSFEASDIAFFAEHLPYRKPIIISTGMMTPTDVLWYVKHREERLSELRILHCVSAYPAPLSEMNLGAIRRYSLDGLSDHSRNVYVGGLAVAAGATIIETHLRLAGADPASEDYAHSFTPEELAVYVRNIRSAETIMGDGRKRVMDSEKELEKYRVTTNNLAARHN